MPRFVLLFHQCPPSFGQPSHWDLMLERDGVLMTWRVAELPAAWQSSSGLVQGAPLSRLNAERLPDHRLAYLNYEGPVSGDRGHVTRVDRGEYDLVAEQADEMRVRLAGQSIAGEVSLPIARPPEPA